MPIFIHAYLCCIKTTQMKTDEGENVAGPVLGHSMLSRASLHLECPALIFHATSSKKCLSKFSSGAGEMSQYIIVLST